jgi:hypothetical protein
MLGASDFLKLTEWRPHASQAAASLRKEEKIPLVASSRKEVVPKTFRALENGQTVSDVLVK